MCHSRSKRVNAKRVNAEVKTKKKRILIAFQALDKAVAYGGVLSVNGPLLSILPKNIKYDRYNSNKYNSS